MIPTTRLRAAVAIAALSASTLAAWASDAQLTVVDRAGTAHEIGPAEFAALPQASIRTHTPWTEGMQEFHGVLLRDVLAAAGIDATASAGTLEATALNSYAVEFPASDAAQYGVLVARSQNGVEMTPRGKGPYWLVYPRDTYPELADQRFDHRWAWQLRQIAVK